MQRLQSLQNGQFGSKIKNAKNFKKNHSTRILKLLCEKKLLEKTPNFQEMRQA